MSFFYDIHQIFSLMICRTFHGKRKVGVWVPIFIIKFTNWSTVVDLWVISCSMEVMMMSKFKPSISFIYVYDFLGKYGIWGGNQQ